MEKEIYQLNKNQKTYLVFKRIIDIFFSFLMIVLLGWLVLIFIFINCFFTSFHPMFLQKRIGRNSKPFKLIKIRSMKLSAPEELTSSARNHEKNYYTSFGNFLRKTSIDELPQLLNIFIGQMSFIGPRPIIDKDEDHVTVALRHENGSDLIRPGMSGLAQVKGRINVDPIKKAEYDFEYLKTISFKTDMKILLLTFKKVFQMGDVSKD